MLLYSCKSKHLIKVPISFDYIASQIDGTLNGVIITLNQTVNKNSSAICCMTDKLGNPCSDSVNYQVV
jgi:hypothetical protein